MGNVSSPSLFIDLYELTMMQSYFFNNKNDIAVFDFFIRDREGTPRRFYVFAGLEFLTEFIENLKFSEEDIKYISELGLFKDEFLDYLRNFKFEGDIFSVEEGRIVFPGEPLVEVVAPLPQAQIIETALINLLQFPILSATKFARCFLVSKGKLLIDFGARRAHSLWSAEVAARCAYITGFHGTSLLSAGKKYGIPVYGTMAHSYIMIYEDEKQAFEDFAKLYNGTVLLVDTYDVEKGVKNAVEVIQKLKDYRIKIRGIRIDSGDLIENSKKARRILDEAGLQDVFIFLSGGINEYKIKEILEAFPDLAGFGVGTEATVSSDLPYLDCAYKLVEYGGIPRMKLSEGKKTFPGRKNVKRLYKARKMVCDVIIPFSNPEDMPDESELDSDFDSYEILLKKVVDHGQVVERVEDKRKYILYCRDRFMRDFEMLPEYLKKLGPPEEGEKYPVLFGKEFSAILHSTERKIQEKI
jgi:nicotinate phosphoribosyltransferase